MARSVFISLTHRDTKIAEALRALFRELFGEFLSIRFSTSGELEGGIKSGEDWFQWIVESVTECDVAFVVITPSSMHKPWILWEAGAVAGAALAVADGGLRKVRPLVFQVPSELIPSPLRDSKLHVMPADPGRAGRWMLSPASMGAALGDLREHYRRIVVDCPPVLGSADVNIIGDVVDAVLLVARAGRTTARQLQRAARHLNTKNLLGSVLLDGEVATA